MDPKPFEIVAECELVGLPSGTDIGRISEQIEKARRSRPEVVRAMTNPPAVYRSRGYVLQTRFVVWAEDAPHAMDAVGGLLQDAEVPCRTIVPTGRALPEAEVPSPRTEEKPQQDASRNRKPAASRRSRKAARKPRRSSDSRRR